jgi:UDP-N-acetylmuramoyl-tripeptide--D-alanyl-D-alanine ligase
MITGNLLEISKHLTNATLIGKNIAFQGCNTDTRTLQQGNLYLALKGENFNGHDFIKQAIQKGAVGIITEKKFEFDIPQLIVLNTKIALGELAKFWRDRLKTKIVAITGSNGKTTTKEILASILKKKYNILATQGNLNNDIGVPLTLFQLSEEHQYAVIEMGANHPKEIGYLTNITQPQVAVITNCSPAHLEGFGNVEGVAQTKGEIYQGLSTEGIAIINANDIFSDYWCDLNNEHQIIKFGLKKSANISAKNISFDGLKTYFILSTPNGEIDIKLNLAGKHNLMNALAASSCAIALHIDLKTIAQGLENMQPINGRLQVVSGIRNTTLLNDTYNANPASLKAALQVLANCSAPRWVALGNMLELGETAAHFHQQAGEFAQYLDIEGFVATGELSKHAIKSFGNQGFYFKTQEELIDFLKKNLPSNATLLIKGSRGSKMEQVVSALTLLQQGSEDVI